MSRSWFALFFGTLTWSAIEPADYFIWLLEVFPALATLVLLIGTRRHFPLTPLVYWLLLAECGVLMVGGHYTYAHVPLFDWISEYFHHGRNNYDKLAHFSQGFVPAMAVREVLVRLEVVCTRAWLNFLVASVCLAISAFYELIEWWVAVLTGTAAEAFLATQGYQWDTQSDMALALLGALTALAALGRRHDAQLQNFGFQIAGFEGLPRRVQS